MAEETEKKASEVHVAVAGEVPAPAVVVADVTVEEKVTSEKEHPPVPEPEPESAEKPVLAALPEKEKEPEEEEKVGESGSFKEETNVAGELPDPQKIALDEFKLLVQEALNKHEFTAPPPPPPVLEKEEKPVEATEEEKPVEAAVEEKPVEVTASEEEKTETPAPPPPLSADVTSEPVAVVEALEKVTAAVVEDDGVKTVEAIEESVVSVTTSSPPPPAETEEKPAAAAAAAAEEEPKKEEANEKATPITTPPPPEEVSIWGIPLLADERSDVILLKFLRARDFKVKEAFAMLKNTVKWRKEFGIESLLEEDLGTGLEKSVYLHGFDKEGHPVYYNVYGEFQNKELYQNTFSDEEKRQKFLRWQIQFLEKSISKLHFSPDGISTFVFINDLKNSPGLLKRELRLATNQALQLLQDNYPEFVAKQLVINVPWWYLVWYRMSSPFFTQRTKSKFVFAGASKTAETLFKYIAPEQVPVQYGGLSKEGEADEVFTTSHSAIEETIKPATKHSIEIPVTENGTLVWESRVVGWEVSYGAEFVPDAEGSYTLIVQKTRKVGPTEEAVINGSYKVTEPGKIVLVFDNQTSKKKKHLVYRHKMLTNSAI